MRYILILFLLVGCGGFQVSPGAYTAEEEFRELVDDYLYYKNEFLGISELSYPILIEFADLEFPKVGSCQMASDRSYTVRHVKFDRDYWKFLSEGRRFNLFLHELGHCDLNLDHQDVVLGIMNTYESIYVYDPSYVENLFLRGL